ncbi:MAG TPA: hypothetical protein VE956_11600 [Nodularia sp. (in: cyanobacteria)]|nr:hypothetical protein [Nodularia sp. (in: cyanobacteria)]
MVHSFILPQETISIFQEQLEILERCLNDANPQDEVVAEILELANSLQMSLIQLREEFRQLGVKVNKINNLRQKLNDNKQLDLAVLFCVKFHFFLKEIADEYWYLFGNKVGKKVFKIMTLDSINFCKELIIGVGDECYKNDEYAYIILESLKHLIQSQIKANLRLNALSEEEINALDLGDITPQESETMLISLASTKKWDEVYKNLA